MPTRRVACACVRGPWSPAVDVVLLVDLMARGGVFFSRSSELSEARFETEVWQDKFGRYWTPSAPSAHGIDGDIRCSAGELEVLLEPQVPPECSKS